MTQRSFQLQPQLPATMLDVVTSLLPTVIASEFIPPSRVPESGLTAVLLTGAVLSLGLLARFVKNRK